MSVSKKKCDINSTEKCLRNRQCKDVQTLKKICQAVFICACSDVSKRRSIDCKEYLMSHVLSRDAHDKRNARSKRSALGPAITRRNFLRGSALFGLGASMLPVRDAFAWSSWTNVTSGMLESTGMGDCIHEDIVQISYARMLAKHLNDPDKAKKGNTDCLINPWGGWIGDDAGQFAYISGDEVWVGRELFKSIEDLQERLYRENLAYLRIGSFWNDAAANTLADFGVSVMYAKSIPKFSGSNHYEGAWDVAGHISETHEENDTSIFTSSRDALVQFTMNERNNFIHGLVSTTADGKTYLRHSEMKRFAMQWLGAAYEYARTGKVMGTNEVTELQAQRIIKGFVDTYGQEDQNNHELCDTLKVGNDEATKKISHRKKRLRALGMVCHTLEDFWCPAHTCRVYDSAGKSTVLAFSNYKKQNGDAGAYKGYHIPFDRYARSDAYNKPDWRQAMTSGIAKTEYVGTQKLENLSKMASVLEKADGYFNTFGMNEAIACITKLFEFFYNNTPWDSGVSDWVDREVLVVNFDEDGQSKVCDAGRRSLHSPTYLIAPLKSIRKACKKLNHIAEYDKLEQCVKQYDEYQRWAHEFFSGKHNTTQSKRVTKAPKGKPHCTDQGAQNVLYQIADVMAKFASFNDGDKARFLSYVGSNGCHNIVMMIDNVIGLLREFSFEFTGSFNLDANVDSRLNTARDFFMSGVKETSTKKAATQAASVAGLFAPRIAYAEESDETYVTTDMEILDVVAYDDGSYQIAVRDLDSFQTSVMDVDRYVPGKDKLQERLANLTITYKLDTGYEGDIDYCYSVTNIEYPETESPLFVATGEVTKRDANTITLDLDNLLGELVLNIPQAVPDVPEVGMHVSVYYEYNFVDQDDESAYFVDYLERDEPTGIIQETYPVVSVCGSRVWVYDKYSVDDDSAIDGHSFNDGLVCIDYGDSDIERIPQEGYYATISYYDETLTDNNDFDGEEIVDVGGMAVHAQGFGGVGGFTTFADVDEGDEADTPGYREHADYWDLDDENDIRHVAVFIEGTDEEIDDNLKFRLFGGYQEEIKPSLSPSPSPTPESEYEYAYFGEGKHKKYLKDSPDNYSLEDCAYDSRGLCIHCGHKFTPQGGGASGGDRPSGGGGSSSNSGYYDLRYPWRQSYGSYGRPSSGPYRTVPTTSTPSARTTADTASGVVGSPSNAGTSGILDYLTGSPATAGTESGGAAANGVAGVASSPVARSLVLRRAVLPNTGDAIAGLSGLASVAAAAGAALTLHGAKSAMSEKNEEQEDRQD